MKSLKLNIPQIDEQFAIISRVEALFLLADTVEKHYRDAKSRLDRLTQSILAKAFRGELVPQDPDDEPAEKLLERIAEARKEADALAKVAKNAASAKKRTVKIA